MRGGRMQQQVWEVHFVLILVLMECVAARKPPRVCARSRVLILVLMECVAAGVMVIFYLVYWGS